MQTGFAKSFVGKEVFTDILGQEVTKEQLKSALLMNRHVLIIGPPGVGKTTLAKNIARLLPELELNNCLYNCDPENPACPSCKTSKNVKKRMVRGDERFVRVQGSPDLTVEDLLGDIDPVKALEFGPSSLQAFTPGKLFKANAGVLFFDELNRCPEKIQNALLQVLEEGKATICSYSVDLPSNFIFIGTLNPEETAATEKLSDVLMDRFDVVHMTYPDTLEIEEDIVTKRKMPFAVSFPPKLLQLAIMFVRLLREHKNIQKKPSVRATIGLYERAIANAFLDKRKEVTESDIGKAIMSVIAHRITLKPSIKYLQTAEEFLAKEFRQFCSEHPDLGGGYL